MNAKVLFSNPAELGNTWEIAELLGLDMPKVEYVHRPNHRCVVEFGVFGECADCVKDTTLSGCGVSTGSS